MIFDGLLENNSYLIVGAGILVIIIVAGCFICDIHFKKRRHISFVQG